MRLVPQKDGVRLEMTTSEEVFRMDNWMAFVDVDQSGTPLLLEYISLMWEGTSRGILLSLPHKALLQGDGWRMTYDNKVDAMAMYLVSRNHILQHRASGHHMATSLSFSRSGTLVAIDLKLDQVVVDRMMSNWPM